MKTLDNLIAFFWVLCVLIGCDAKRGFILTAPKSIDAGSTEYFTFTAFDVPHGGQVTLTLLHWYTEEMLAESKFNVLNNINMWVEMSIPHTSSDVRAKLRVEGTFSDGYRIDSVKEVLIRHNTVITFVQTDKPIYKPGQTVRFRVLPLDSQLKPLDQNTVADIWMEDPSGIRVSQWKKVKFTDGMVQLELPLSNEPPLGTWSIKSLIHQISHTQKFNVEKYVLPKFDVKVNPPAYIMADADSIPLEICAWYTYGKKVDGTFKTRVTYKKYAWEGKRKAIPSVEYLGLISGCQIVHINTQDILLQTREFGYRTLEFFAEVTENTTAITGNGTATSGVTHSALQLKFLGSAGDSDYFKPGIPFYGELSVHKPDGVIAANEKVEICANYQAKTVDEQIVSPRALSYYDARLQGGDQRAYKRCHMFTSNKKGRIHFSLPPKSTNMTKISLMAEAVNYHPQKYREDLWQTKIEKPHATLNLHPWFSPSGSYVQIQSLAKEMECEKLQRVKVRYTAEKGAAIKFYHQVLSRGRIVQQGSHQRTFYSKEEDPVRYDLGEPEFGKTANSTNSAIGEFLLSFDPRATMTPVARLLVFYVREDGEIVADSRMFRIAHCLLNKVNLHFRHEQQYPSTEASLLLSASPSSVCGIGLVDKSVRLLKSDDHFKKENIFKVMEKYDVGKDNRPHQVTDDYCMQKQADERAVTESDNMQPTSPHFYYPLTRSISIHVDTSMAFEEAGMVVISNFELETRPCVKSQPVAIAYNYNLMPDRSGPPGFNFESDTIRLRSGMTPVAPAPKKAIVEEEDETTQKKEDEIRNYFPETWLWEMHTVGSSGEMALKRQLPHTITQWVGGAVCVHPKTGLGLSDDSSITAFQPFFLSFHLPYSVIRGEVLPLVVSVFNYLSECLPIKLSLEPSDEYRTLSESCFHTMCVCGGESKSHRFAVKPGTLGRVNVTVYGFSLEGDDDGVCGNEVTARLSARDAVSKQLLVEAEGFPKEEVFNYYVCPENTNGSYATEVDLLLPEDVVEGSGRAFVSVTGDVMGPALNGLRQLVRLPVGCGEQNMVLFTPNIFVLDYLTTTGRITEEIKTDCLNNMKTGYQRELKYRHKDGSYSAFGDRDPEGSLWLTAFVLRSFGQARRFVDVDEHDLRLSTSWILSKQFENGCFEPSGFLLNKAMKGGLGDSDQSLAPLTAFVLVALLESGAQRPDQPAVRNALRCLEADGNPSSYALALFAYAAALGKEPAVASKYLRQLDERAVVKGGHMYWDINMKDGGSKSVRVEIAGYYILGRAELGGRDSAAGLLPVVRWITQQRNANGGFVSTQDTVVALQALARYSSFQSSSTLDMGMVVESDELVKGFKLEENNKLVTQTVQVPVLPAVVDLQAVGDGCALVQFSLRYNLERISGSEAFDLNIDALRLGSSNCNLPRLGICMRYRIPDQSSNMVVVAVKMASGFLPDEWSLYELQSEPTVQLMRHEVDGNLVNLYFNELTNDQKCFTFYIKSELEVEEIKPSSIKLYDYYQPELEITKEYIIPSACTVSSLPEMPWLPPLIIDAENDDELDTILIEVDSIMVELPLETSSTTPPEGAATTEGNDIRTVSDEGSVVHLHNIPQETTTNDIHLSSDKITDSPNSLDSSAPTDDIRLSEESSHPEEVGEATSTYTGLMKVVTSSADTEVTVDRTADAGLMVDETTTTGIVRSILHLEESEDERLDYVDGNRIEMADDASVFQTDGSVDHLINFVTVDGDRDFPDGIEGNVPVSVLPPSAKLTPPEVTTTPTDNAQKLMDCPVCLDQFPENFTDVYCSSSFALRVIIRDGNTGTVRILHDLSNFLPQPKPMKKFAKLEYDRRCLCPQLREKGSINLILGTTELWDTGTEGRGIRLTSNEHVISSPLKAVQPVQLKTARSLCNVEP